MVSDKRKEIIIDSNMTIAELSFLFLENKYERIAVKSYGTYQDRLGIINEYLGSIKLKDFRKERIKDFENYLKNERNWNYTFKPSDKTINEIISVLNQLLNEATRWNLLDEEYNCIVKDKVSENERINLIELQNQINNIQKKMASNSMDKIWKKEVSNTDNKSNYDTILSLAKKSNFKKIMIMRDCWNVGNWCIVNTIKIKPDGKYCRPYGYIKYANGDTFNGYLPAANTYSWKLIKVLDEDIKVIKEI